LQGTEGETQISVSNQVDKLIQEATSNLKLVRVLDKSSTNTILIPAFLQGKMYVGWTPWVVSGILFASGTTH
jgi:hypothetical protein